MATWGGVGTYTRELLTALLRDRGSLGIEHVVAFRSPDDAFLEESVGRVGIAWEVAPGSPWSPIANARMGLAARGRADVFHAPHFPVPLGFGGPLVTTIHDLIPLLVPESMPGATRRLVYEVMVRWAVARSDVIVCVTRAAASTVTQRFGHARLRVIHHGMGRITPGAASPGTVGGYGLRPGYVLWVGAFKPHKGVPTLLSAHRRFPPEFRGRHPLVLVGDDQTAEGHAFRRTLLASPEELGSYVHVLGPVSPDSLSALYESAGAFAFPSHIEGFGLPPLEAMAHDVPVVSSSAAPMPEVLGEAATYFAPGDADDLATRLREVLDNPATADRLRQRGTLRIRRYSWDRASRETVDAYRLALAPGGQRRFRPPDR
ncbi:MAG: glycosyltransferase family 4 protein [Thermoleophilia bacterium]